MIIEICAALVLSVEPRTISVDVGSAQRTMLVFAPNSKQKKSPLVFAFHGHGGNSQSAARTFSIHKYWPEAISVYMQGIPIAGKTDPNGVRNGWQKNPGEVADRDLKFFDLAFEKIRKECDVDLNRVYVTGHSNGGRFTYLLWAMRGNIFAAVAPSASPPRGLTEKLISISALFVAGEKDELVPFESQKQGFDHALKLLKLEGVSPKTSGLLKTYIGKSGSEVASYFYAGGHTFPDGAALRIVEFFKRHAKSE